jgi:hypothetical protein
MGNFKVDEIEAKSGQLMMKIRAKRSQRMFQCSFYQANPHAPIFHL